MYNNYHWCEMTAYEKITGARRAAAHDRLAIVATRARRDAGQGMQSWFARLFQTLASGFGHSRPSLEATAPAGHAR